MRSAPRLVFGTLIALLTALPAHANRDISFSEACSRGENIEIVAVGDVLLHQPLQVQGMISPIRYRSLWTELEPIIARADIAYANFEGPAAMGITAEGRDLGDIGHRFDRNVYSGYPRFNYHPFVLQDLKTSGFDIVSTSNNHSMDRGAIGADKTIEALRQYGLNFVGTRTTAEAENADFPWYSITQSKGRNIAWVACTFSTNGMPDRRDQVMMCFQNQERLFGVVGRLARDPRIHAVIVTPHWGVEYNLVQNAGQTELGRQLIEAGATAVLGTHAHVVQPWEKVTTRDGREGLVVYGSGNFVSNQPSTAQRTAAMVQLNLTGAPNQKLRIRGVSYLPLFMERSPARTVIPVFADNQAPTESFRIWENAFGSENRMVSANENQMQRICQTSMISKVEKFAKLLDIKFETKRAAEKTDVLN